MLFTLIFVEVPEEKITFIGLFPAAFENELLKIELLLLPPLIVDVLKKTSPEVVFNVDPRMVQLVMVLLVAPSINLIVEVVAEVKVEVLLIVSELPPVFKPSMVTLSAPFKFIKGPAMFPLIVLVAPPLWLIPIEL